MSRSSKKGPFVQERLLARITSMNEAGQKNKLGEFAPTRTFRGHAGDKAAKVKR